jgi:hypothetical protein
MTMKIVEGSMLWVSMFNEGMLCHFSGVEKDRIFMLSSCYTVVRVLEAYTSHDGYYIEIAKAADIIKPLEDEAAALSGGQKVLEESYDAYDVYDILGMHVIRNGGVYINAEYVLSGGRDININYLEKKLRKFRKELKEGHKYRQLRVITSCIMDHQSETGLLYMMCNEPEYFV